MGALHPPTAPAPHADRPGSVPPYAGLSRFADRKARCRSGGSGLGLPIARELVVSQGGEISVESREGHGTTMRFTLPIAFDTLRSGL